MIRAFVCMLSALNGVWMLFDGVHYLRDGEFIGAPKIGPWAKVVRTIGIESGRMAWPFIAFGAVWLAFVVLLALRVGLAPNLGIVIAIATLWYAPIGTLVSIIVLIFLLCFRSSL